MCMISVCYFDSTDCIVSTITGLENTHSSAVNVTVLRSSSHG
jgi:hypothetical protein